MNMNRPRPSAVLNGVVEKIIESPNPDAPQIAQIAIEGADDGYGELRVTNSLKDDGGGEASFKPGARVQVTVKAQVPAPDCQGLEKG
jgi:hypothetical protein